MGKQSKILEIFGQVKDHKDYINAINEIGKLQLDDKLIFDFFWSRAIKKQNNNEKVAFSAVALRELNPKCQINLELALKQICSDWDISIEEVPWYLCNQFTNSEINHQIDQVKFDDETMNKRLDIIRFWINIPQHKIKRIETRFI
jgi:hypothetical protein